MTRRAAPAPVLGSVDRAAFVVALGERLRAAGVPVSLTSLASFAEALGVLAPRHVPELYWSARITLVTRAQQLPAFDAVFDAVFADAVLPLEDRGAGPRPVPPAAEETLGSTFGDPRGTGEDHDGLPWHTRPQTTRVADAGVDGSVVPELLPSALAALGDVPFDRLDEQQLALVGAWLERSRQQWPTRRSRRRRPHHAGSRVELRATIAASRRTGFEPLTLRRSRPVLRPRPVTMVADVSASMQPYAGAYLHLMRAVAGTGRAETFAFSTSLTRITPALRLHSVEQAIDAASDLVQDRYGGTHLASSLTELMRSRHGNLLRGGVLVIASDGWDSDDPERLAAVLARVRRRVHRLVWLNPRAGASGFEPLVGSMAAALPFCDEFLPAHTLRAMTEALDAIRR